MDNDTFKALKNERRRLQGSVNYWQLHVRAWRASTDKYAGDADRRDNARTRLAYCESRLAEAKQQHAEISAKLSALDPAGSKQRQLHNLHTQLSHARQQLAFSESCIQRNDDPSYRTWHIAKIERLRAKLSELEPRTTQLRSAIDADRQQAFATHTSDDQAHHLAVAIKAYESNELASQLETETVAQIQELERRQEERLRRSN